MSDQMPKHGTFCWNELATNDLQASTKFYTELLGWEAEEVLSTGHTYTMFKKNGTQVGGMLKMSADWGNVPPHWMSYITVDDVDASVKEVEKLGGKVCVPPTDIPTVGRFAVINDPTGAAVSLMTFLPRD